MPEKYEYLTFNLKVLKIIRLWTLKNENENSISSKIMRYFIIISCLPSTLPLVYDVIMLTIEPENDTIEIIQVLLAVICTLGAYYMSLCFLRNRVKINDLVERINDFKDFCGDLDLIKIDERSALYTKLFMLYSSLGIINYVAVPLLSLDACEERRSDNMKRLGIPCGLVARYRLPFKFDYTPLFQIALAHQIYLCTVVTFVIVTITMLLCGFLLFVTEQLKYLRGLVLKISTHSKESIEAEVRFCIRYHNIIIKYSENINEAFSSQMLMHITLTSFVISVLGFEILMVNNLTDSIRFTLHLLGWFVLLYLVCFYGQKLIDESTGVAEDVYSTLWYNCPISIQKDLNMILMRAQKPLTLNAINLGVMSFARFLNILSSAYSYFTLLVNIRS